MMHVRAAGPMEARAMAGLLGEIIEKGGTTAMTEPVSRDDLVGWMRHYSGQNAWFLAEDNEGGLLGFQWIEPKSGLPSEACTIATFTRVVRSRLGTGSALFEATRKAAAQLGYSWINEIGRASCRERV